jgi:HPt (histidine-containing phosphotransfer) domain-containing protein
MGDRQFMEKILSTFREQAAKTVEQLAGVVTSADAAQVRRVAHGLKGAAANLSAEHLRSRAALLEEQAAAGALEDAHRLLDEIRAELERCVAYVPPAAAGVTSNS